MNRALDYFCSINMGQSPDSKTYNTIKNGIPFYQGNADFGLIHPKTRIWCNSPIKIANKNDILISVRAPIGALNIADKKCCIGRGLASITPYTDRCELMYLYYALHSKVSELNAKGTGSTFKAISKKNLLELKIPQLNLYEQRVVITILCKLDDIIEKSKKLIDLFDNLIKSRFMELFDNNDFPLATIADLVAGKVSSAKKDFEQDDIIKYIDISSIDNKRNLMTGYTEYVLKEAPSRAQQHVRKGDIVISTVRPNLKNVAITTYEDENLVASSGFCVLRASKCLPEYLLAIVISDKFADDMTKVVTGANYPAIKDSDVMNYQVSLPPLELQTQFAEFVEKIDKSKFEVKKSLEKLELLKKSLMQKYFG